jgi:hypothetical protein
MDRFWSNKKHVVPKYVSEYLSILLKAFWYNIIENLALEGDVTWKLANKFQLIIKQKTWSNQSIYIIIYDQIHQILHIFAYFIGWNGIKHVSIIIYWFI